MGYSAREGFLRQRPARSQELTQMAVCVLYDRHLNEHLNEPSRIPQEERGRIAADSPAAAAHFIRSGSSPGGAGARTGSSFRIHSCQLFCWAHENGKILAESYLSEREAAGTLVYSDEGAEHIVYYDEARTRAVKVTRPGLGDVLEYLESLSLANDLFGDDVFILGVVGSESSPRIIISQKWIFEDATAPDITRDEIDAFFEKLHFIRSLLDDRIVYYSTDTNLLATDAHPGNFMRSEGRLVPIDINVQELSPEMGERIQLS
jgi:hypothetical protein